MNAPENAHAPHGRLVITRNRNAPNRSTALTLCALATACTPAETPHTPKEAATLTRPHDHVRDYPPYDLEDEPDEPGQGTNPLAPGRYFADVTEAAGISHRGETYGQAWGDVDGDGDMDLWVGNHARTPSLYINQGDGTFTSEIDLFFEAGRTWTADAHGVLWVDIDADGDQDLIETVGAGEPNHVYIQQDGVFLDAAEALGLADVPASGRCAVALDWNLDGRLDLVLVNQARTDGLSPTSLFTQSEDGTFVLEHALPAAVQHPTALCATLANVDDDPEPELLRFSMPSHLTAHDLGADLQDVSAAIGLPSPSLLRDIAVGDFDNDGHQDVYVTRWMELSEGRFDAGIPRIRTTLRVQDTAEGFRFRSDGTLQVSLEPPWFWGPADPRVGASCTRPFRLNFPLDPSDPEVQGMCPFTPGEDQGLFIGHEDGEWTVMLSVETYERGNIDVTSTATISDITWLFPELSPEERLSFNVDTLLRGGTEGFENVSATHGITSPNQCTSVVAGDFDNDMDLDLYLTCASPVQNQPNQLLLNQGDGTFVPFVEELHGAEGPTAGRADTVIVADYDMDGALDLFVTNGFAAPPLAQRGPDKLFRNHGNDNHWLEIDLHATEGHPDAIGSQVWVTAGGVTQTRQVGGATHRTGQSMRRLHVGLGPYTRVDTLRIRWPDGREQTLIDVDADQILAIEGP